MAGVRQAAFGAALAALALSGCAGGDSPAPPQAAARAQTGAKTYTLAQKRLLEIVAAQNGLLDKMGRAERLSTLAASDLISEKKRVDSLWNEYFAGESRDAESYAIYGKYLRATSNPTIAYAAFLKADALDPSMASVKHQLAVYEAENGQFAKAYRHFSEALGLAPDNSVYLSQTAKFLMVARAELAASGGFDPAELDAKMLGCYRKWADASAPNSPAKWECAKAFYQVPSPDWGEALARWEDILENATISLERQTALANKARVLIELRRDAEAREILGKVDNPHLAADRKTLLDVIGAESPARTETTEKKNE